MIIFVFVLGLCLGSFLNVLIDRLPKGEQVIGGRSYCDHCYKKLGFFDLIPLLSFLFLKGKCRYCGKKISFYYPLVELITGLCFLFILTISLEPLIVKCLLLTVICCLIVIFFTDLKYGIIPDEPVVAGVLASVPLVLSASINNSAIPLFRYSGFQNLMTGTLTSASFFLLFLITRGRGMGLGDVKLAFLMGFLLGWPKIIVAIYLSFLTGALVGVILILIKKKKFGQTIPFGPFLVLGTLIAQFWGEQIMAWWPRFL